MKTWGIGGIAPPLMTSTLDEIEWSALSPIRFNPQEFVPATHWIGDLVGPKLGLDIVEKRKTFPSHVRYGGVSVTNITGSGLDH
jgi:hypothetical protein